MKVKHDRSVTVSRVGQCTAELIDLANFPARFSGIRSPIELYQSLDEQKPVIDESRVCYRFQLNTSRCSVFKRSQLSGDWVEIRGEISDFSWL